MIVEILYEDNTFKKSMKFFHYYVSVSDGSDSNNNSECGDVRLSCHEEFIDE